MSNYFETKLKSWRKQASVTAVNDLDIEKAFADQASGFVENKLEPLMRQPYNVGFEIVRKNDDNTRIVGIFAFKIEDNLIFAPVFFLNGEIKGPLLYRCDTKTFVPANKEWASFLIESLEVDEGKGIPRTRRGDSAPLVQMQRINFMPNGTNKSASVKSPVNKPTCTCSHIPVPEGNCTITIDVTPDYSSAGSWNNRLPGGESLLKMAAEDDGTIRCVFEDEHFMLSSEDGRKVSQLPEFFGEKTAFTTPSGKTVYLDKAAATQVHNTFFENVPNYAGEWAEAAMDKIASLGQGNGLIHELLNEPDFGKAAAEAIVKAASTDATFAEALAECYHSPEELFPESYSTLEKKAADEGVLVIKYTPDELEDNSIKEEYFRDGFYILDSRPKGALSVVTENTPSDITAVTEPGVYCLLKKDGTFEDDVLVAPEGNPKPDTRHVDHTEQPNYYAIKDGKAAMGRGLMGVKIHKSCDYKGFKDTIQEKKCYMVYLPEFLYGVMAVREVKTLDGVTYAKIAWSNSHYYPSISEGSQVFGSTGYDGDIESIVINPELTRSNTERGHFGKDAKFVELKVSPRWTGDTPSMDLVWKRDGAGIKVDYLEDLGTIKDLDKFIYSTWKLPKVTITKEVTKEAMYRFSDGARRSDALNKCVSLVKLARDMALPAEKAYELLHKADVNGKCEFYLDPIEKVATKLRVVDRPTFDDEFDSEFGVPLQPTKEYKLRVQGDQIFEPPSAIGDAMNPTTLTGLPNATVITTSPENLRALADTYKLPHVFEHGVVGSLADTFDALYLLNKYVPRIEDAVDALGRLQFLIYWRPGDFEKVYGSDDMTNLEAEVTSNFDALGAMLLRLLKKTELQRKGVDKTKTETGQR
jgi:hypothetical protein